MLSKIFTFLESLPHQDKAGEKKNENLTFCLLSVRVKNHFKGSCNDNSANRQIDILDISGIILLYFYCLKILTTLHLNLMMIAPFADMHQEDILSSPAIRSVFTNCSAVE